MQLTETRGRDMGLLKLRDFAQAGVLVRKATIGAALKRLEGLRDSDVVGRAEVLTMTETIKASFFLSPSGTEIYGLKPRVRTINGVKMSMLSVTSVTPVSSVLSWEAK